MRARCKSERCRAPVVWALTDQRKRIPLDVGDDGQPVIGPGGNLEQIGWEGPFRVVRVNLLQESGLVSHWATCPDSKSFRKK